MRGIALALIVCACSARTPKPGSDAAPADAGVRPPSPIAAIAHAEARRGAGRAELEAALARPETRVLAVRGLARIGDDAARARLVALLDDPDEAVRSAAAIGIGVGREGPTPPLVAALGRAKGGARAPILEALGRVGDDTALAPLVASLDDPDPAIRRVASIALGRFGRRVRAIGDAARTALVARRGDPDAGVRYAVAYALSREVGPLAPGTPVPKPGKPTPPPARDATAWAALVELTRDAGDETRAVALAGHVRRKVPALDRFREALADVDWRVRVEAVRGLAGPASTVASRAQLATWLVEEWTAIADLEARLRSARPHAVIEGVTVLLPHAREREVARALAKLHAATDVRESTVKDRYTPEILLLVDTVNCLAATGRVRAGAPFAELLGCGEPSGRGMPLVARRRFAAEQIVAGTTVPPASAAALLEELWAAGDVASRVAALDLAAVRETPRARAIVAAGIDDPVAPVAESAAGAIAARAERRGRADPAEVAALVARAATATPIADLRLAIVLALVPLKAPEGGPVCERWLADPNVTIRASARECLAGLGRDVPTVTPAAPEAFAVIPEAVAAVAGRLVTLEVETSKGRVTLELDGGLAPLSVATIVSLARDRYYDGVPWHRVVPDFVAQTGDPTGTGAGGPGFQIPAEPWDRPYTRGTVGIADLGHDTGGSQWFVTHTATPHLEGRYTVVGRVTQGQDVVDALVVGDRIVSVRVVP